jgi:xylulokinase
VNNILGIDIGTSGCKLVILDEGGSLIATTSHELHPRLTAKGTVEISPNDWYMAVVTGLRELSLGGADLKEIVSVGVTGQMQGSTYVDSSCNPVRDSILWSDTRSGVEVNWMNQNFPTAIEEILGYGLATGLTAPQILWVKTHEPEHWKQTHKFLHAPNFIIAKLTGEMTADHNNIGLSGLNDFKANGWSHEILDFLGIDVEKVPELRSCFESIGVVSAQAASQTGLRQGTTVVSAGGDSAAENYSIALANSDRVKIRLGSAGDMNVVVPFTSLNQGRMRGIRDVLPDYVLLSAWTKACAVSVKWARSVFFSELPLDGSTYARMDLEAAACPAGSDGLIYFPYLSGEATPYFNNEISAKFLGMRPWMNRGHFARAVYEGVSYSLLDAFRSTREFDFASKFIVVGGGAKSAVWVSILSNVMGHDIVIPKNCDAAFGAALIAGESAGIFNGASIAQRNLEASTWVVPDAESHEIYQQGFTNYLKFAGR